MARQLPRCSIETAPFTRPSSNTRSPFSDRGSYTRRRALRDADIADLFDVTREDLEHQTSLPSRRRRVLDFLTLHRANDPAPPSRSRPPRLHRTQVRICAEQLDISLATISTTHTWKPHDHRRLRKLFLTHIEQPASRPQPMCS